MRKANGVILALLCLLFAAPAMAALDASHHDIPNYLTSVTTKDKCFYCHGLKDANSGAAIEVTYGKVGSFCVTRCHSGLAALGNGGAIRPQGPATNGGAGDTFTRPVAAVNILQLGGTGSHGDNTAKQLYGVNVASSVAASTLPYTTGAKMECTSCHAVHDAANTPFLWSQLSATTPGVNGFCDRCHLSRANNNLVAGTNPNGNHPVDFAVNYAAALARTGATIAGQPPRSGRTIHLDWTSATLGGGVFDVPTSNGAGLNGAQSATVTGQYQTGGHLGNFAQYSGVAGDTMGCYTCHSAHQPGTAANNLTVLPITDSALTFNPLCMGCHGADTTWALNATDNSVGRNSPAYYGHPFGAGSGYTSTVGVGAAAVGTYTVSVGGFTFTVPYGAVEAVNTQSGIQFGNAGELLCTTCHDVHLGVAGTKALANLGQGTASICNACHNGSELADVQDAGEGGTGEAANAHHRTTTASVTASYKPANDLNTLNINTAWVAVGYSNQGLLSDGLQCADCHQFNGTAHNW